MEGVARLRQVVQQLLAHSGALAAHEALRLQRRGIEVRRDGAAVVPLVHHLLLLDLVRLALQRSHLALLLLLPQELLLLQLLLLLLLLLLLEEQLLLLLALLQKLLLLQCSHVLLQDGLRA